MSGHNVLRRRLVRIPTTRCPPARCWASSEAREERATLAPARRSAEDLRSPELRVDCPDEQKFDLVEQGVEEEFAAKYPVSDARRRAPFTFQDGWGLLRALEYAPCWSCDSKRRSPKARDAYRVRSRLAAAQWRKTA